MVGRNCICSILFALIFFFVSFIRAQGNIHPDDKEHNSITQKKEELSRVKKEITSLELELKAKTKKEKKAAGVYDNISRQSFLLNKLINKLLKEEQQKQKNIAGLKLNINSIGEEIKAVRDNYAKYIRAIYKSGKNSEWAFLFNSNSVQQALLRYKYLKEFSGRRKKSLNELREKKDKLKLQTDALNKEIREKELITEEKLGEKNILVKKLKERKKILNTIKHDKKSLADELKLKKNSEAEIKAIINKLVEQADKEKDQFAGLSTKPGTIAPKLETGTEKKEEALNYPGLSLFAGLKGKMDWPVNKGKIVNNFGENRNKILNTVTINYGIDIQPGSDNNVRAVAAGIVSAVEWIPGYGSVIIITHSDGFRTVYGRLSEIFAEEGDDVKEGQVIATVAEELEGRILHFEIWNSRVNQDPGIWLKAAVK